MGKSGYLLEEKRKEAGYRSVKDRLKDFKEIEKKLSEKDRKNQAARCMDCGVPFCHWACPIGNIMPEWQDYVYKGKYQEASDLLHTTNNFPEFTGRVCPALCEASCVLSLENEPVTIRENELAVAEKAFNDGFIKSQKPKSLKNKKVAVVGSGPAGLAAAQQLTRAGYTVTLFEKNDRVGGILRYGIPDYKLDKSIIDRRLKQMVDEGLTIKTKTAVGRDISIEDLKNNFDAIAITIGAQKPRDIDAPGRKLKGIYFALVYLALQNRKNAGDDISDDMFINAKDKNVLVIGGGDTGSDCVGTANRQGAKKVWQIEIMPKPNEERADCNPWPQWPLVLRTSSAHKEGCEKKWNILTKEFIGEEGKLKKVKLVEVIWKKTPDGKMCMEEKPNSEFILDIDLVFLAMGFVHPVHTGLVNDLKIKLDNRGNIETDENYMTSEKGIFAAGDARKGPSLVVWAISEGRKVARRIDQYLSGSSNLSDC